MIEALHAVGYVRDNEEAGELALTHYRLHPFDETCGCWNALDLAGAIRSPDSTFNHQVYFAAAASLLFQNADRTDPSIEASSETLPRNLALRDDGRIVHAMPQPSPSRRESLRRLLTRGGDPHAVVLAKEPDYHLYDCYAFALLGASGIAMRGRVREERFGRLKDFAEGALVAEVLDERTWTTPQRSGTDTRVADKAFFETVVVDQAINQAQVVKYLDITLGRDRKAAIVSTNPVTYHARTYRYWRLVQQVEGWSTML